MSTLAATYFLTNDETLCCGRCGKSYGSGNAMEVIVNPDAMEQVRILCTPCATTEEALALDGKEEEE